MIEIFKEKTNVDNGTRIISSKETKLSSAENVKRNNTHENRTQKNKQIEFTDKIRKFPEFLLVEQTFLTSYMAFSSKVLCCVDSSKEAVNENKTSEKHSQI